jgi:hypothetical protein
LALDRGNICPFLFSFGPHLGLILFPFQLTPAQLLVIDLLISIGAANMTILLITAPLVLVLLTNTTITLLLLTQRKSGKWIIGAAC